LILPISASQVARIIGEATTPSLGLNFLMRAKRLEYLWSSFRQQGQVPKIVYVKTVEMSKSREGKKRKGRAFIESGTVLVF
jgi:hypothetical protein